MGKRKGSTEYEIWCSMKARCYNKNKPSYKNYGGRGIIVCDEWMNFDNFFMDMGKRPSKDFTLDRIDNNKGYSKENCRWASKVTQARNRRVRKGSVSKTTGVTWDKNRCKWAVYITVNKKLKFLGRFHDLQDAIDARKNGELMYWR